MWGPTANLQFGDVSVTPNYEPRSGFQDVKQIWFGGVKHPR